MNKHGKQGKSISPPGQNGTNLDNDTKAGHRPAEDGALKGLLKTQGVDAQSLPESAPAMRGILDPELPSRAPAFVANT